LTPDSPVVISRRAAALKEYGVNAIAYAIPVFVVLMAAEFGI
jgi:hypothetical protein